MKRTLLLSAGTLALMFAGSAAIAQASVPAPGVTGGTQNVLQLLMLGGLMGVFGQGLRTVVGFRTAIDAASLQGATQEDVFRAARVLVSLFIGFLAGVAATFVVGLVDFAAAVEGGDPVKTLLGIAAAGYSGTDFLEGFFGQYFKGVAAPALAAAKAEEKTHPNGRGADQGSGGAPPPPPPPAPSTDIKAVREEVAELKHVLLFSPGLAQDGSPQEVFRAKAPGVMQQLIADFDFTDFQAAGILGNIGHECLGFTKLQEIHPVGGGRGGYGWCQWTGPRRRAFEAWAAQEGLPLDSDEANYGFLKRELETTEHATVPAVKRASTLEDAVLAFQTKFERPGVPHPAPRVTWGRLALDAFRA